MEIVEYAPTKFDASEFVSYLSEELTTPTERELNEELPEWKHREAVQKKIEEKASKPRRGVGFLRAENSPDVDFPDATEDSEVPADVNSEVESNFGEGIDDPATTVPAQSRSSGANRGSSETANFKPGSKNADGGSGPGKKRRRRRGRRSKSPGESTATGNTDSPHSASLSTQGDSVPTESASETPTPDKEGAPAGKRKPRNRRRRRRGSRPGGEGSPPPSDD